MKKKMAGAFRRAGECLRRALVRYKAIHLSNDASLRIRRAEKEMGVLQEVFEEELPGIEEEVAGLLRRI
jgi:hypothetical protein